MQLHLRLAWIRGSVAQQQEQQEQEEEQEEEEEEEEQEECSIGCGFSPL